MLYLNAKVRSSRGKSVSRRLRLKNKIPAIIYGGAEKPTMIEIRYDHILNMQDKKIFYTEPLVLVIDGKENKVRVQEVQFHPFKLKLTHVDFIRS
ncbi:50S ribosomal protein L25 [Sodalis sp. CWE]|uniref:50S ribosomal protein L25 n=1 Tax=Sodalis sp. CWE TaxID=2803816 RepID=UPI001C7D4C35|nr:50S ribosomal protein L25 [Sodalis sp. CWE]MBX4180993.1 50S ribosomal protein L25 [Sodalis sp. CWE]